METQTRPKTKRAHCLVLAYPTQGHVNPMLQFSKRLVHKGLKVTLVTCKSMSLHQDPSCASSHVSFDTISDGYDRGGIAGAETIRAYLDRFWRVGPETLAGLVERKEGSGDGFDCIVYDAFLPWALDVAKRFGLVGAVFFTMACGVDLIMYHAYHGGVQVPVTAQRDHGIMVPGLTFPLKPRDMPSLLCDVVKYPAFCDMLMNQFSNVDQADWVLCNTFHALEPEVVDWMAKVWPSLRTIGPTIPSMFMDKKLKEDKSYGFSLFKPNTQAMKWLSTKPKGSVIYVSFGSMADLGPDQMEALASGLKRSKAHFLWVVRASEQHKMPKGFAEDTTDVGLVVFWSPQLEVLAHESVGCFLTHCGWNSTLEALSLGVPLVAMPQWTDQTTNAKFVEDVWGVGLRVKVDENGFAKEEDVELCVREVMEGERGREIRKNARKWKKLATEAMDEGGSSDINMDEFVDNLVQGIESRTNAKKIP